MYLQLIEIEKHLYIYKIEKGRSTIHIHIDKTTIITMPQGKKLRKNSLARKKRNQPYKKRGKKAKQVRVVGAKDGMAKRNAKFSKFKNKKVTGKINLNIESIMAAKVLRNRGGLRMGDLKALGRMTDARLKEIQKVKDSKKRIRPAKPEKVYVPRI